MWAVFSRKTGQYLLSVFTTLFFLALSVNAAATEDARKAAQVTIKESLDALWTGQAFSPDLKKKQQTLRDMLTKGIVTAAELEDMTARTALAMLDGQRTTRYILAGMPERVNEFLSPHLDWERFRGILWREGGTAIKAGKKAVVSVGTLAPAGTPWLVIPEKVASEINKLSNNKIIVRVYSGGVMGEDVDILRKMDVGQLDACGCTALGILSASPETSVFLLPGLFNNYDEVDYIFKKFRPRIDRAFEERGYILAALIDTGYFHIFSKNRISSLADIKRSKMLTWFGEVETTLFNELGISAMPVSVTEVVSALSTGMADTNVAPAAWMLGMQAYQYANFFVKEPLLYSPAAVIVSSGTRERLQRQHELSDNFVDNLQELLVFEFISIEEEWKHQGRKYEEKCMEAFTTRVGMEAVTLPEADRRTIEEAGKKVWARLADRTYPKDLLDEILLALEEYRQSRR